jgi:membrane-bound ClpP family serine protease
MGDKSTTVSGGIGVLGLLFIATVTLGVLAYFDVVPAMAAYIVGGVWLGCLTLLILLVVVVTSIYAICCYMASK